MKIRIKRQKLLTALQLVSSHLNANLVPKILNNVLLSADGSELTVTTYNGSQSLEIRLEAEVTKAGEVSVPAICLRDLVAKFKHSEVTLSLKRRRLEIADDCGVASLEFANLNELLEPLKIDQPIFEFKLNSIQVELGINQTIHCASKELSKRTLMGVNIKLQNSENTSKIEFCATDAHRLTTLAFPIETGSDVEFEQLIDRKTCNLLLRTLSALDSEQLKIIGNDDKVEIRGKNFNLIANLIKAEYPSYRQLIPSSFTTQAILDREQTIAKLHLASAIAKNGIIELEINRQKQQISISAKDSDLGTGRLQQEAEVISKEQLFHCELSCNYLLTCLRKLSGKEVKIMVNQKNTPILINNLIPNYSDCILMPVQRS